MSHYTFQLVVLTIGAILTALWARHTRGRPAQIKNGFHVVRWGLGLRLLSAALLIAMLSACAYFSWLQLATDEKSFAVLWFLLIPILVFAAWTALIFRVRNEYNETILIAYDMFGKSRQFTLSDFTRAGSINWRGHEFSTEPGDRIYVNAYQTGGPTLIELLQRQVKESDYE
jgi:hypothetical protein